LPLDDPGKAVVRRYSASGSWWQRLLLATLFLGVGFVAGVYLQPFPTRTVLDLVGLQPPAATAPQAGSPMANEVPAQDVVALGRLRPDGGVLALALPSGAGDARIARLLVSEGQQVEAGETVAELDNMAILLAAKDSMEFSLAVQQVSLEQVRTTMLASLAEARANHLAAEATLSLANEALVRQSRLAASNSTTQVLVEEARANALKARADFDRTAALAGRFSGAESGQLSDIVLAARNVDLARSNLMRAEANLTSARVVAPRAGRVLDIHARVGEKPSTNGVVTIGDVTQMTAELEVYQTNVGKIALGQAVTMTAQALPVSLKGTVTRIGQIVGHQSVMSTEPAANADARVVRVTVTLDAESSTVARSYTHLEIVGRVRAKAR
jgi:HlyD family secretion protein